MKNLVLKIELRDIEDGVAEVIQQEISASIKKYTVFDSIVETTATAITNCQRPSAVDAIVANKSANAV